MFIILDKKYKGKHIPTVFYNNPGIIKGFGDVEPLARDCKMITVKEGMGIDPMFPFDDVIMYVYLELEHKDPIGIRKTEFEGYSLTKSFYSPPYDKLQMPDPDDARRTLYRNPSVKTDANGKASVSFYNNSSADKINISAETVTSTGMMGVLNQ